MSTNDSKSEALIAENSSIPRLSIALAVAYAAKI